MICDAIIVYASGRNHVVKPLIQEATHLLGRMVDVHMYYLGKENFGAHPLLDRKEVFRNSFVLKKYLILFSKTKAWNWIILLTGHSAAADFSGRASHSAYAANIAFIVTYIHCLYNYIYYLCKWKKWVLGIIFESLARVFFAFWKKSHSFVRKSSTGFSISRVLCCRTLSCTRIYIKTPCKRIAIVVTLSRQRNVSALYRLMHELPKLVNV